MIPTIQSEPSLEVEQIQEVQRRMEEVRSGRGETIPGEEVFREMEQPFTARRMAGPLIFHPEAREELHPAAHG